MLDAVDETPRLSVNGRMIAVTVLFGDELQEYNAAHFHRRDGRPNPLNLPPFQVDHAEMELKLLRPKFHQKYKLRDVMHDTLR